MNTNMKRNILKNILQSLTNEEFEANFIEIIGLIAKNNRYSTHIENVLGEASEYKEAILEMPGRGKYLKQKVLEGTDLHSSGENADLLTSEEINIYMIKLVDEEQ